MQHIRIRIRIRIDHLESRDAVHLKTVNFETRRILVIEGKEVKQPLSSKLVLELEPKPPLDPVSVDC